MAFTSYEDFRAAIADPARVHSATIPFIVNAPTLAATLAYTQANLVPATALHSAGGALLDHTSATAAGLIGYPIPMPSVEGRSWYIYSIDIYTPFTNAITGANPYYGSIMSIDFVDLLWHCTIPSGTTTYAVTGMPTLTRYADGYRAMPAQINSSWSATDSSGNMTISCTGYNNVAGVYVSTATWGTTLDATYQYGRVVEVQDWWSEMLYSGSSASAPRGGVKNITQLQFVNNNPRQKELYLLRNIASIPVAAYGDTFIRSLNVYNEMLPFIELPPGSDGNYACLVPFIIGGGTSTSGYVRGQLSIRMVEG